MRVNRGVLGWGIFLIALGAVPLAVRQGAVSADAVERLWTLWPLVLVAAGLGLVLRRTPIEPVAGVLVAALAGVIGGSIIATGSVPFASCGDERGATGFDRQSGDLGPTAEAKVELGCGDLTIRVANGTAWSVEGADEDGSGPTVDARDDELTIESSHDTFVDPLRTRERWTVTLPADTTLDLEVAVSAGVGRFELDGATLRTVQVVVNAGEATIDLSGVAAIEELDVQLNAVGSSRIMLPSRSLTGAIHANAASGVRICAPTGVGLRLTADDNITATNNYAARGLIRNGDAFETPGFDSAETRIDLRTEANAGGFELEPEGSCDG